MVNKFFDKVIWEVGEGYDVMIVIDFLIWFLWVYNVECKSSGCIMLGGVDVRVMEILRKLFGVVRKIENGGLFMILVMVFVDIGSCMD